MKDGDDTTTNHHHYCCEPLLTGQIGGERQQRGWGGEEGEETVLPMGTHPTPMSTCL